MEQITSRDPSAPNFSVVLCEHVERTGPQDMLREDTRDKVISRCTWRHMPAEQH